MTHTHTGTTRRAALLGLPAFAALGTSSLALAAAPTERRFVVIVLRGAMDGLSAVVPYGDPGLKDLRPGLIPPPPGQDKGLLDLGGTFGLHPAMSQMHALYRANELLIVHAAAGHYRDRSHFEAQDYLESGADRRMTSGWLNRAAAAMPAHGGAIAIGQSIPLLLRGKAAVSNWAPHGFGEPGGALYQAILALHQDDKLTGPALTEGMRDRGFGDRVMASEKQAAGRYAFPALAKAAGAMMAAPDGPRIAALDLGGWDTHTAQANRIGQPLAQLDAGIDALRQALGAAWKQTVVLAMTEFGRTARANGTGGTDHGTASSVFIAGGAVAGGRVTGTWPGLAPGQLFENRDLAPTTDLRAIAKSLLAAHLGLGPSALAAVFPGAELVQPMRGLVRA